MNKSIRSKLVYKGLAIMWFIFGCVFIALPLLAKSDGRSVILGSIAAILFHTTAYLNWKKYKNSDIK